MWYDTDYAAATCNCEFCKGREVRLWNGLTHRDAILSNPDAVHNVSVMAIRMPFAHTANKGAVLAEKIPAHA